MNTASWILGVVVVGGFFLVVGVPAYLDERRRQRLGEPEELFHDENAESDRRFARQQGREQAWVLAVLLAFTFGMLMGMLV